MDSRTLPRGPGSCSVHVRGVSLLEGEHKADVDCYCRENCTSAGARLS